MTTKITVVPEPENNEEIETQPMSRIAKLKSIAKDPMLITAAVTIIGAGVVLAVKSRKPMDEMTEEV